MRSYREALAALDLPALVDLLEGRPDLCVPRPADLHDLAARASTSASTHRALDRLNRRDLVVTEALAALPDPTTVEAVTNLLGVTAEEAGESVAGLRRLALLWGEDDDLHLLRNVRAGFEPHPGGLAAPSIAPLAPAAIATALEGLDEGALGVLNRLLWGPPTGSVRHADRVVAEPSTPVEQLLARGLLRPTGSDSVILPREVALHIRGGFLRTPLATPEPLGPSVRRSTVVDHGGVGAAYQFTHDVEGLIDDIERRQPKLLRTGGIALRDLSALAQGLGTEPDRAGFLLEVAQAADLIGPLNGALVPTGSFDRWLGLSPLDRWRALLQAWAGTPRWYAGARGPDSLRPLSPEVEARWAVDARNCVLAHLQPGYRTEIEPVTALVDWHRPSLARIRAPEALVRGTLTECQWFGLVALDTATALVRALEGSVPDHAAVLFPDLVEDLIVQGDLTAVATGPLTHPAATTMRLLAEPESRGGGGVFRFTATSIRRAFDAGWSSEEIEQWLGRHSRTGVPQPLSYLIGDVARTHGTVRVGSASAYVRIDDPAALESVLSNPAAAGFGIRQVGPHTLIADAEPHTVVALLQSIGLAPAAEDAAGSVVPSPGPRRAPTPRRTPLPVPDANLFAADLLRTRDRARERAHRVTDTLGVLEAALSAGTPVAIDYVAEDGTRVHDTLVPTALAAGMVRLAGPRTALSLPLGRVTAAALAPEPGSGPDRQNLPE